MDSNVINLINKEVFKTFNGVTLIDINSDSVAIFKYEDTLKLTENNNYEEYYEKLKKIIHPDYLNKYFDAISLNNLKDLQDGYNIISYSKLSSTLAYDNYFDVIKLIDDAKILVLSIKGQVKHSDDNKDLSFAFAEIIVNIENVLSNIKTDNYDVQNIIKYINALSSDAKRNNPSVLANYQNMVKSDVNKSSYSLLIVDDDNLTRNIFKKVFESDYNIIEAKNGAEAVEIIEQNIFKGNNENPLNIVGIFLDLKMPVMDGFGVLDYLTEKGVINTIPVVIVSADDTKDTKETVYSYQIADLLEKPFNFELIKKRIGAIIGMYAKSSFLNDIVKNQEKELKSVLATYVNSYLITYEENIKNVSKYAEVLFNKYKETHEDKTSADLLIDALKYYDVALLAVPRKYTLNINSLSDEERKVIINYPLVGEKIVKNILENQNDILVKVASNITLMHNERCDGKGFPNGLKGENIPWYVYLTSMAIEINNLVVTSQSVNWDTIKNIILSKKESKYSIEAITVFENSLDKIKEALNV